VNLETAWEAVLHMSGKIGQMISLYLIKCSLAPCSGYLEKQKQ